MEASLTMFLMVEQSHTTIINSLLTKGYKIEADNSDGSLIMKQNTEEKDASAVLALSVYKDEGIGESEQTRKCCDDVQDILKENNIPCYGFVVVSDTDHWYTNGYLPTSIETSLSSGHPYR